VARLERDGLLQRSPDPDDGRGYRLRLKPAGRALHAKVVPMVLAREQFLLEALDPAERELLLRALTRMGERAEQLRLAG
jgi:DNA-binding MarR family transcriptional regulator